MTCPAWIHKDSKTAIVISIRKLAQPQLAEPRGQGDVILVSATLARLSYSRNRLGKQDSHTFGMILTRVYSFLYEPVGRQHSESWPTVDPTGQPPSIKRISSVVPSLDLRVERCYVLGRSTGGKPALWIQRRRSSLISAPALGLSFDVLDDSNPTAKHHSRLELMQPADGNKSSQKNRRNLYAALSG